MWLGVERSTPRSSRISCPHLRSFGLPRSADLTRGICDPVRWVLSSVHEPDSEADINIPFPKLLDLRFRRGGPTGSLPFLRGSVFRPLKPPFPGSARYLSDAYAGGTWISSSLATSSVVSPAMWWTLGLEMAGDLRPKTRDARG